MTPATLLALSIGERTLKLLRGRALAGLDRCCGSAPLRLARLLAVYQRK
jgi:hypothetical protein